MSPRHPLLLRPGPILLALLTAAGPGTASAHHCELWAWSKDGASAAMLCTESCRNCPGREEILILGPAAPGKPAIVWQAGDVDGAPEPAAREPMLRRSADWLRSIGFDVPTELPPYAGGHPAQPGAFPGPGWKTVILAPPPDPDAPAANANDPAGRCAEGVPWPGSHAAIPVPVSSSRNPGLMMLTVSGCARNENRENVLSLRLDLIPFGESVARWMGQLAWIWDTGHVSAEIDVAVSPQSRAVLLRRQADSSGRTREVLFPISIAVKDDSGPHNPDLYPGAYGGTFGENVVEYLSMPWVLAGAFLGSIGGGGDSYAWHYFHLAVLEYLTFGEPNQWWDIGVGGSLFSYQRSDRGSGWSILGFGPALRIGRLILQGRVDALSFMDGDWRPGLGLRAMLPLATPREAGMWGIFIPIPMVGYDVWYRSNFEHDETHFFWGVTWLGNFF
jgi:hypothetical protein